MSVHHHGLGTSSVWCLVFCLHGCAVSAVTQGTDTNAGSTADAEAGTDAALELPGEAGVMPPDMSGGPEAGVDPKRDTGPIEQDAGLDASTRLADAMIVDSGPPEPAPDAQMPEPDATVSLSSPTIDGEVHDSEWADATWETQNTPSDWGVTKNLLLSLGVLVRDGHLWFAVRGIIESSNAVVIYFDGTPGVGLAPSAMTDATGALDDALSAKLTVPASFGAEVAWGTRSMSITATSGFNASTGFRGVVDAAPGDLAWIDGTEAPTVCSATACEAKVPLTRFGAGTSVSLFARIGSATGTAFSNQTLPEDAFGMSSVVTELLTVSR